MTFLPLFMPERTLNLFVREDGIFEDLTAVYLLMTSILLGPGVFRQQKSTFKNADL